MELIDIFKKHIGSFIVADYRTPGGNTETAMGKLESVSNTGDILIIHLKDNRISWGFNLRRIESYKFSPIKEGGENDG